jgi:nucleotide-binding universal stress UspA family protein
MAMKLPLLVTTDLQQDAPSVHRTRAVNQVALAFAKRLGTSMEMLHVANIGEIAKIPQAATVILDSQKEQLKNLANPFEGVSKARFVVGHPVPAITKLSAQKSKYELLVQGTSGKTGLSRAFLGSVAEEVLRHSRIPVMTVGPEAQAHAAHSKLASQDRPVIVVATELEKTSVPAERYAIQLAKKLKGRVHAVHHLQAGFHPLIQTAMSTPSGSRELQDLIRGLKKDAEKALAKVAAQAKKAGVAFSWTLVETGIHASEAVIDTARAQNAALVVMGTHARGLVMGSFLGSTARGVILGSPAPVITVRR